MREKCLSDEELLLLLKNKNKTTVKICVKDHLRIKTSLTVNTVNKDHKFSLIKKNQSHLQIKPYKNHLSTKIIYYLFLGRPLSKCLAVVEHIVIVSFVCEKLKFKITVYLCNKCA